jgi:hypothetical protein
MTPLLLDIICARCGEIAIAQRPPGIQKRLEYDRRVSWEESKERESSLKKHGNQFKFGTEKR